VEGNNIKGRRRERQWPRPTTEKRWPAVTEDETLGLVRKELLEIFEAANDRSREGKGGSSTSTKDMLAGKGTPTEYLLQVIQERVAGHSKTSNERVEEMAVKESAVSRWEGEGGAMRPLQGAVKSDGKK
jgi:hypothetical protein